MRIAVSIGGVALLALAIMFPGPFSTQTVGGSMTVTATCGSDGEFFFSPSLPSGAAGTITLTTPCGSYAVEAGTGGGATIGYTAGWNTFKVSPTLNGVPFECWAVFMSGLTNYNGGYNPGNATISLDLPAGENSNGYMLVADYNSALCGTQTLPPAPSSSSTTSTTSTASTITSSSTLSTTSTISTITTQGTTSVTTKTGCVVLPGGVTIICPPAKLPGFNVGAAVGIILVAAGFLLPRGRHGWLY